MFDTLVLHNTLFVFVNVTATLLPTIGVAMPLRASSLLWIHMITAGNITLLRGSPTWRRY